MEKVLRIFGPGVVWDESAYFVHWQDSEAREGPSPTPGSQAPRQEIQFLPNHTFRHQKMQEATGVVTRAMDQAASVSR